MRPPHSLARIILGGTSAIHYSTYSRQASVRVFSKGVTSSQVITRKIMPAWEVVAMKIIVIKSASKQVVAGKGYPSPPE